MTQFCGLTAERPLIVSVMPFKFQATPPVVPAVMVTLPFPNPLGMTSLAPLIRKFEPLLLTVLAWMVVSPVQSFKELDMQRVLFTVPDEPRLRLNEPVIFPPIAPGTPPLPPRVVS